MGNICFIDFETTGNNPLYDNPLEFGAILIDNDFNIIKEFESFVNPDKKVRITDIAFEIHGIDYERLRNEPAPSEMLSTFFNEFGTSYCFAGWNIGFDITFFRRLCNEYNFMKEYNEIDYHHIDVQTLVGFFQRIGYLRKDYNSLSAIADYLKIERNNLHSALQDAKITFEVYKFLLKLRVRKQ